MRALPVYGTPLGKTGGAAPALLTAGVYWKSGLTMSSPYDDQGWTAGLPGLTSGASVVILRIQASPLTLATMNIGITYRGTISSEAMGYWDGSAVQTATPDPPTPWNPHVGYGPDTNSRTFTGGPTSAYFYWAGTESTIESGNMQADSLTVAA